MTNDHTPATPQDLDAVQLAAQKRQQEILLDADSLDVLAQYIDSKHKYFGAAAVMRRCARTLRELVS